MVHQGRGRINVAVASTCVRPLSTTLQKRATRSALRGSPHPQPEVDATTMTHDETIPSPDLILTLSALSERTPAGRLTLTTGQLQHNCYINKV